MHLLDHAARVGAVFNDDEQASVMHVWRYAECVMGVPTEILYDDRDHARQIFRIAHLCEPTPDADAATMANALIGAIPLTAGIDDERRQREVVKLAYRLSRALIGAKLADQLQFPRMMTAGSVRLSSPPKGAAAVAGPADGEIETSRNCWTFPSTTRPMNATACPTTTCRPAPGPGSRGTLCA